MVLVDSISPWIGCVEVGVDRFAVLAILFAKAPGTVSGGMAHLASCIEADGSDTAMARGDSFAGRPLGMPGS